MSARSDVLLWAQRIVNKGAAVPTQLLEVREAATLEEAQTAFHKIAKMAHPDLHRTSLSPEELELVTTAYSRVANAYQELRSSRMQTSKIRTIPRAPSPVVIAPPKPGETKPGESKPIPTPVEGVAKMGPGPATQMTPKALVYYRKAELSLRRGDLKAAVLQLKMAIAADPLSSLLRSALSEVESEIGKSG